MAKESNNPKIQRWVDDNLVDDKEDNFMIAQIAMRELSKNFRMAFTSPETVLAAYATIYDSIVEVLIDQRENHSSFDIDIAGRFEIGYSDADQDVDMEKMGSFVPHIFDLNSGKKTYEDKENKKSLELCIEWMSQNVTKNTDIIKKISTVAFKNLKDRIGLHFGQEECCIPVFVNIHECMISYLKLKQEENGEYETTINFASCFDVIVRMTEDKEQIVEYCPSIAMKLTTKSDAVATAKHE